MAKKKKKKRSAEKMHRQVQDSIQALPYAIDQYKKEGKKGRAVMLRYFTGPMLRLMNRALNSSRYRGEEGQKLRQTEQMKRHLEQRKQAMQHMQGQMQKMQKQQRRGRPM